MSSHCAQGQWTRARGEDYFSRKGVINARVW